MATLIDLIKAHSTAVAPATIPEYLRAITGSGETEIRYIEGGFVGSLNETNLAASLSDPEPLVGTLETDAFAAVLEPAECSGQIAPADELQATITNTVLD